jgi:hypothetical protein
MGRRNAGGIAEGKSEGKLRSAVFIHRGHRPYFGCAMKDFIALALASIQLGVNLFAEIKKSQDAKERDEIIKAARAHDRDRLLALLHK